MEKNNELVVILSHADTSDKKDILHKCVLEIKKQEYKILVSSHIDVEKKTLDVVKYFSLDRENPLIFHDEFPGSAHVHIWFANHQYEQNFALEFNHSFAVLRLIKNGIAFALFNGYDKVHFVNYDYVLYDASILERHSSALETCDLFSYYYEAFEKNREHINTGLFSVKTHAFSNVIRDINTKEDFLKKGQGVFEKFVYYEAINNGLSVERDDQESILNTKNVLNSKSTLKNVIDDNIHVYPSFEESTGRHFVYLNVRNGEEIEVKFVLGEKEGVFVPKNFGCVNLVEIDQDQLEKGVTLKMEKFNFVEHINKKTHFARCNVKDPSIITGLNSIIGSFDTQRKKYTIEEYCSPNFPKKYDIINYLANKNGFQRYLEIGVHEGNNIRKIEIPYKDGVDSGVDGFLPQEVNYKMTSDDFFSSIKGDNAKYDVILIDGLHHTDQVDRDIKNSVKHLNHNGYIILHNCNPPEYFMQKVPRESGLWNGDVWKSIVKLRCSIPYLKVNVIDIDFGVGVIKFGPQDLYNKADLETCLEYDYFDKNREELLNIISAEDFFSTY